jgi:hydrogenase maturation protease
MEKKIIAMGNVVMCDDGIGIKVAEFLIDEFNSLGFKLLVGETDIDYSIKSVENNDFMILLTPSYYDVSPGTITINLIDQVDINNCYLSQYSLDFLKSLNSNDFKVSGYIISIEASEFYFNPDLSPDLKVKFSEICNECLNHIKLISKLPEQYFNDSIA